MGRGEPVSGSAGGLCRIDCGTKWGTRAFLDILYSKNNRLKTYLAEREGFEPSMSVTPYSLSRGAPSAARPPLRGSGVYRLHAELGDGV